LPIGLYVGSIIQQKKEIIQLCKLKLRFFFTSVNIAGARCKLNVLTIFCCSRLGGRFVDLRKRGGGIGDWRTLFSEEIHDLCFSPHTIYVYGSQTPSEFWSTPQKATQICHAIGKLFGNRWYTTPLLVCPPSFPHGISVWQCLGLPRDRATSIQKGWSAAVTFDCIGYKLRNWSSHPLLSNSLILGDGIA